MKKIGLILAIMSISCLAVSVISCSSDTGLAVMTGLRDGTQAWADSLSYESVENPTGLTEKATLED